MTDAPDPDATDATDADHPGTAAEEAGIVDQQAAAIEAMDDDEGDPSPS